jgi:pimeloyl-ACP methyl ester carboxylesterase
VAQWYGAGCSSGGVALIAGLTACADVTPAAPSDSRGLSLLVVPCDENPLEPGCGDPGAPVGGRINTADTYFTANVSRTYTLEIPIDDAGNTTTLTSDTDNYRVESGYGDGTGASILQDVVPFASDAAGEAKVMRLEGGAPQEVNHLGQVMSQPEGELDGTAVNWLAGLPNLNDHPELMTALMSGSGNTALQVLGDRVTDVSLSVARLETGAQIRGLDRNHFELSYTVGATASTREAPGMVARFERGRNGRWAIQELNTEAVTQTERGSARARSRMRFLGRRIVVNEAREAMRAIDMASRRKLAGDETVIRPGWMPAKTSGSTAAFSTSMTPPDFTTWNPPGPMPFPIVPPTTRPPVFLPDPEPSDTRDCVDETEAANLRRTGPHTRRVAFQHGFLSGACTWRWMTQQLGPLTPVRVVSNTPSLSPYESQAQILRDNVSSVAGHGWVFIGHSNGGVVSRYSAQTYRTPQQLARAVITLNSPHSGAQAMATGVITAAALRTFYNGLFRVGGPLTTVFGSIGSRKTPLDLVLEPGSLPRQMSPGSPFLGGLNTRSESHFRRYAIRSEIKKEWVTARVYCDVMHAPTSEGVPGGRRCVRDVKRTITRLKWRAAFTGLLSIGAAISGIGAASAPSLMYASIFDAGVVSAAYVADWWWKSVWGYPSDGIVPMSSQNWATVSSQNTVLIGDADSHVGSTRSDKVRTELTRFLNREWTFP